jgi:pyrroline-5-carboxylate reductase
MKSMRDLTIGFIGAGNMAEAIIRGLLERRVVHSRQLIASDPSGNRRALVENQFSVEATTDNRELLDRADVIILAVKPQVMGEVLRPLADFFRPDQLVISIAAGLTTATLDALCGHRPAIVRIMPNTPALIGKGISAICSGPRARDEHLVLANTLFASVGATLRVNESEMDAVTAISGSGPAYVFYWMEAMLEAAKELGFSPSVARQLVYETLAGSAALAHFSSESPDVLRARVTSKGGTTEAAVRTLDDGGVRSAVVRAIHAAAERSRELSRS